MCLTGSDHSDLCRTGTASSADRTRGGRVVYVAGEVHDVANLEFQCRRSRRSRTGVVDPGKLAVLLPGTCIVPGLGTNVPHSGDLNTILPFGRTLNGKPIPNVDADVTGHPHGFTRRHRRPVGGTDIQTPGDHAVGVGIGNTIGRIFRTAPGLGTIPFPTPQDRFDQVDTVEPKIVLPDQLAERRLLGCGVPRGILAGLGDNNVLRYRSTKHSPHVDGIVVLCNVFCLRDKIVGTHDVSHKSYHLFLYV